MILIPTLLIFLASEYISLNIYGDTITIEADGDVYKRQDNHIVTINKDREEL